MIAWITDLFILCAKVHLRLRDSSSSSSFFSSFFFGVGGQGGLLLVFWKWLENEWSVNGHWIMNSFFPSWTKTTMGGLQTWVSASRRPWCLAALWGHPSTWLQSSSLVTMTTVWMSMPLESCSGMCVPAMSICPLPLSSVPTRTSCGSLSRKVCKLSENKKGGILFSFEGR